MSINDFMNKIKGQINIDGTSILLLLVFVCVALGSFGLGRLSVGSDLSNGKSSLDNNNGLLVKEEIGKSDQTKENFSEDSILIKEKMYVASKNGKLYYTKGCAGASRIKPENQMWFSSRQEAEESGFAMASSCN